jgi:putative ABC transport system ATP-binding protein
VATGYAVQTRQLTKAFRSGDEDLQVLKGVDLDVPRGEFVSIMGPSGSGKSTLLNLVGLLDVPSSGAIRLMGTETHRMGPGERAKMRRQALGFVFQSFNLMPRLNALHNVMLPMAIAGIPRRTRQETAKRLLGSVGLGDRLTHRPSQLSGGQKQRVAIARALALDPPILLADEPTGNLDSKTSLEVMELFVRLNESGKTILQVTHDEDMAAYGGRIIRFRDGRIVAQERKAVMAFEEPSFALAPPKALRAPRAPPSATAAGSRSPLRDPAASAPPKAAKKPKGVA